MAAIDPAGLLAALAGAGRRVAIVATGGGAGGIASLVAVPGASSVVVEGAVPYAREAIDAFLGGRQETYCSSRAARRLAMAAWQRARRVGGPVEAAVGAAVTASLVTTQPKRGDHRVIAALQTSATTQVATLVLEKGVRTRDEEEAVAAALLHDMLAAAVGPTVHGTPSAAATPLLRSGERVVFEETRATPAWQELVAGDRHVCGAGTLAVTATPAAAALVFPGSFDPLHDGHLLMARIAEEIGERPLAYELSVTNVDKPPLDYVEIAARAAQFAERPLWLTRASTFLEKLDVFPGATFVMGADTYARLADPRYYGGSDAAALAAAETIATRAGGLVVFGRERDGVFEDAARIEAPACLRDIAYFVSHREFRLDISSTALRRAAREREEV